MENEHPWAVVVFMDDDSVAAIPNVWLKKEQNGNKCYWPPRSKNASSSAKKRESPAPDWHQFSVKILGHYDTYEIALKKSVTAEDTSDLSSCTEIGRRRKINKKYESLKTSSSESEKESEKEITTDSEEELRYPKFPHVKKKNDQSKDGNISTTSITKIPLMNTPPDSPRDCITRIQADTPKNNRNTTVVRQDEIKNDSDKELQKLLLRKLNLIYVKLESLDERLEHLEHIIEKRPQMTTTGEDEEIHLPLLPLKTAEELQEMEQDLQDKLKYKLLVKNLSRIGGTTPEITKKIMYQLMANELGQFYSWEGGKGKKKI